MKLPCHKIGLISLLFCPMIVILMASLHTITVPEKKVFSQGGLAFSGDWRG